MNYQILLFVIFVVIKINLIYCYGSVKNFESASTLSSDNLEELLRKERLKRNLLFNHHQKPKNTKIITTTWKFIPADDVDTKSKDLKNPAQKLLLGSVSKYNRFPEASDENLRTRKVWSRWGKWGQCSVTCGEGTISRKRVCVLGRCAPGEMEEQRHPCTRAPCLQLDVDDRREQD